MNESKGKILSLALKSGNYFPLAKKKNGFTSFLWSWHAKQGHDTDCLILFRPSFVGFNEPLLMCTVPFLLGVWPKCPLIQGVTLPLKNSSKKWTFQQLFRDSSVTLPWLFRDSSATLSRLFCDSFVTLSRLFCDSIATLSRLFRDSFATLLELFALFISKFVFVYFSLGWPFRIALYDPVGGAAWHFLSLLPKEEWHSAPPIGS